MPTDYTSILPRGKKKAISTPELVRCLGFKNSRELQKDIAASRAEGQIICSSTTGGYYIPETREEIQAFINTLENRAKGIFITLRSARAALREIDGQLSFSRDGLTVDHVPPESPYKGI